MFKCGGSFYCNPKTLEAKTHFKKIVTNSMVKDKVRFPNPDTPMMKNPILTCA